MASLNAHQPWPSPQPPVEDSARAGSAARAASPLDAPVPSPAVALQAQLASNLAGSADRRRWDLTGSLTVLFCALSWWAVISFGVALLHGYQGR
jgi:hypothetical protein